MISVALVRENEKGGAENLLGFKLLQADKCFILYSDDVFAGAGVLSYENCEIIIKAVKILDGDHRLYDILMRSMLNTVRDLKNIKVKVKSGDTYFEQLGFKKSGEVYECLCCEINFTAKCAAK